MWSNGVHKKGAVRGEWHLLKPNSLQFPRIFVIPAQAGIQENGDNGWLWILACAGMTVVLVLSKCHSC